MDGSRPPRNLLRHADLLTALVVVGALGYTGFAMLHGADRTSHRAQAVPTGTATPAMSSDVVARASGAAGPDDSGTAAGSPTEIGSPTATGPIGGPTLTPTSSPSPARTSTASRPTAAATTGPATSTPTRVVTATAVRPSTTPPVTVAASASRSTVVAVPVTIAPVPGTLGYGATISLRATTACCTDRYLQDRSGRAVTTVVTASSAGQDRDDASWVVRPGLADASCVSFESRSHGGTFLRHSSFRVYRQSFDGTALFRADATFCPRAGRSGTGTSFAGYNFPTLYLRHFGNELFLAGDGGTNPWDSRAHWADDVSWIVTTPWSP